MKSSSVLLSTILLFAGFELIHSQRLGRQCTRRQIRNGQCRVRTTTASRTRPTTTTTTTRLPPPSPRRRTSPSTAATTQRRSRTTPTTAHPKVEELKFDSSSNDIDIDAVAETFFEKKPEFVPKVVQMIFHVCVGGCDGCLNLDTPDNKGLRTSYPEVKRFCREELSSLSLADCLVLMGTKAVEAGMDKSSGLRGKISIPFQRGRTSCENPDDYRLNFEFPRGDDPKAIEVLEDEFDLTRQEAIALLGAHSVGRCRPENSGFDGPWDFTEFVMDNGFYKSMIGTDWIVRQISGTSQFSTDNRDRMMLIADISLSRNLRFGSSNIPLCTHANSCPRASDSAQVNTYAGDEVLWAEDFVKAFLKMVDKKPTNRN